MTRNGINGILNSLQHTSAKALPYTSAATHGFMVHNGSRGPSQHQEAPGMPLLALRSASVWGAWFQKNISFYQWRNSQQLVAQGHDIFACYIISYVISMCSHIMSAENHRVQYLRILMADCHEMFGQLFQLFGLAFCPDLLVP